MSAPAPLRAELTEPELEAWGRRIGAEAATPLVLALRGDLGAGKSTLARAVARGAGIAGEVPSPTFNLRFGYDAPRGVRLAHLDLYRLERAEEVWELGWADLGAPDEIVLVEWPERAEALLPPHRWDVTLEDTGHADRRLVVAQPVGRPPALPPMRADAGEVAA